MKRFDIIQKLIDIKEYKSYLEIGLGDSESFSKIKCENKVGIEPDVHELNEDYVTHCETSDEFFAHNKQTFDLIFIDGLHHADQVYRDTINSLLILNSKGIVMLHDLNPPTRDLQAVPRGDRVDWNGDCWKAWVRLRKDIINRNMFVIDTDWGCGIIQEGINIFDRPRERIEYENFEIKREQWLNLVSVEQWLSKIERGDKCL